MPVITRRMKLSAIGASSVTLIPATDGDGENHPNHLPISQAVFSTNGATPPAEYWGLAITEGMRFKITIEKEL
jgi:hypothetical protein